MGTPPHNKGNIPNLMSVLTCLRLRLYESGHTYVYVYTCNYFLRYSECSVHFKVQLGNVA